MGQKALQLTLTNSAATPSTRGGGGGGTATSNGKCAAGLTSTETAAPTPSSPEITFLSSLPCFDTRPSFFSAIQSLSPSLRSRATRLLFQLPKSRGKDWKLEPIPRLTGLDRSEMRGKIGREQRTEYRDKVIIELAANCQETRIRVLGRFRCSRRR